MNLYELVEHNDAFFGARLALGISSGASMYAFLESLPIALASDSTTNMISATALLALSAYTLTGSLLEGFKVGNRFSHISRQELRELRKIDDLDLMRTTAYSILTGPYKCIAGFAGYLKSKES